MYTYKCYFHPKCDSAATCKGCKLPVCGGCQGLEGFCPECVEKRKAVQQLKNLRSVVASRAGAASTTARLKLAIQQAGPAPARRHAGPLSPPPSAPTAPLAGTRPLDPAMARAMTRQLPTEPVPQPRRYNPDAVAYKPVMNRAPEARHPAVKRPAAKTALKAKPQAQPAWLMPFAAGLGVGLVLVAVLAVTLSIMHKPPKKAKPLYQHGLTQQEVVTARALLGPRDAAPLISLSGGERVDPTPQVGWRQD